MFIAIVLTIIRTSSYLVAILIAVISYRFLSLVVDRISIKLIVYFLKGLVYLEIRYSSSSRLKFSLGRYTIA